MCLYSSSIGLLFLDTFCAGPECLAARPHPPRGGWRCIDISFNYKEVSEADHMERSLQQHVGSVFININKLKENT